MQILQEKLKHNFSRIELLEQALTHKSFRHENGAVKGAGDNEKLEFLGDAVLDLALSQYLMNEFPNDKEGALSKKRASLVNEDSLAQIGQELGLADCLKLGKGEKQTGGGNKPRLIASSLEAIIGAIFIDAGYVPALKAVAALFGAKIKNLGLEPDYATDFKTRLQEVVQEQKRVPPLYRIEKEIGPDHDKQFEVSVVVNDQVLATGIGRSKKTAEQEAAKKALDLILNKSSVPPKELK